MTFASQHSVPIDHAARQVSQEDFRRFTHILASDEANLRNLNRMRPNDATAEVRLWGSYEDGKQISDPYYGGMVSANVSSMDIKCAQVNGGRTASRRHMSSVHATRTPF